MAVPKVLLVEDNPADIELLYYGFEQANIECDIAVAADGVYAKEFLNKEGDFKGVFTPEIIVLDIGLPRLNGIQVLQYVKSHSDFKKIPVIMLTSSSLQTDMEDCQNYMADSYTVKSPDVDDYPGIAQSIYDLWNVCQQNKSSNSWCSI